MQFKCKWNLGWLQHMRHFMDCSDMDKRPKIMLIMLIYIAPPLGYYVSLGLN